MVVVTLDQQYNIGEKLTVVLYIYIINRHAGDTSRSSNIVVITHCCCLNGI